MTLAYRGGKPIITTPIKLRDSFSPSARAAGLSFLHTARGHDLSGYLAGAKRGGPAVQRLETAWSETFEIAHTIACNSATSAILAALTVLKPDTVHIPVMGMSAIAAVPHILGIEIMFHALDEHYCLDEHDCFEKAEWIEPGDVILPVNLFGHPARLHALRKLADNKQAYLLEDNAQGLMAREYNRFAGTIGHIGIWSGNVHKPFNTGELGLLTTADPLLASELRGAVNHGEAADMAPGLNLRPTELTAVLGLHQMAEGYGVVARSEEIALGLLDIYMDGFFKLPRTRERCRSAWYCLAIEAPTKDARDRAVPMLQAEGLPCRPGYVRIDKMAAFQPYVWNNQYPEAIEDHLLLVELCSLDPTDEQVQQISDALTAVGEEIENGRRTLRCGNLRQPQPKTRKRRRTHPGSKKTAGRGKIPVLPS